jgi:hypothetical protein
VSTSENSAIPTRSSYCSRLSVHRSCWRAVPHRKAFFSGTNTSLRTNRHRYLSQHRAAASTDSFSYRKELLVPFVAYIQSKPCKARHAASARAATAAHDPIVTGQSGSHPMKILASSTLSSGDLPPLPFGQPSMALQQKGADQLVAPWDASGFAMQGQRSGRVSTSSASYSLPPNMTDERRQALPTGVAVRRVSSDDMKPPLLSEHSETILTPILKKPRIGAAGDSPNQALSLLMSLPNAMREDCSVCSPATSLHRVTWSVEEGARKTLKTRPAGGVPAPPLHQARIHRRSADKFEVDTDGLPSSESEARLRRLRRAIHKATRIEQDHLKKAEALRAFRSQLVKKYQKMQGDLEGVEEENCANAETSSGEGALSSFHLPPEYPGLRSVVSANYTDSGDTAGQLSSMLE